MWFSVASDHFWLAVLQPLACSLKVAASQRFECIKVLMIDKCFNKLSFQRVLYLYVLGNSSFLYSTDTMTTHQNDTDFVYTITLTDHICYSRDWETVFVTTNLWENDQNPYCNNVGVWLIIICCITQQSI